MSNKLSVGIICKNEEERLARCLASVSFADEIVVLDAGSTDGTLAVARQFTDRVHVRDDWPGFGEQRRRLEDLLSHDWVFMIDSDEVVSDKLREAILSALQSADTEQVFRVNRLTFFCGRFIRHSGWYPDWIVRLYNRQRYRYNRNQVHESVDCKDARPVDLVGDLLHYAYKDLSKYMQKRMRYADDWARGQHAMGKRASLFRALMSAGVAFIRHYVFQAGFLDGRVGFLIARIQMQYTFRKYMLLRARHRQDDR